MEKKVIKETDLSDWRAVDTSQKPTIIKKDDSHRVKTLPIKAMSKVRDLIAKLEMLPKDAVIQTVFQDHMRHRSGMIIQSQSFELPSEEGGP